MKKLLIALGVFLALLIAAPLLATLFIDQAYYKTKISHAVESATGRPLIIAGDLRFALGLRPRIEAHRVKYPNAEWGARPWAADIEAAEFTLDLRALLRGKVRVAEVVLRRPRLHIEKNADGVYNLATGAFKRDAGGAAVALPLWLNVAGVDVVDGDLTVQTRNRHWDLRIERGRIDIPARDAPVTVEARGAFEEAPAEASATLAALDALLAREPSALQFAGWLGDESNRISGAGRALDLLRWRGVDLQLDYQIAALPALSKVFVVNFPAIEPFAGHADYHQPRRLWSMQLRDIEARSAQFGLRGVVTGQIRKLYRIKDMDLRVTAAGDLAHPVGDWLAGLAGDRHSHSGDGGGDGGDGADGDGGGDSGGGKFATEITAALRGSVREFDLTVESATAENARLVLRAAAPGVFKRAARKWRGQLPLAVTVKDAAAVAAVPAIAALGEPVQAALAEFAPVTATATVERTAAGAWNLRGIEANLARESAAAAVEITGAVDDMTGVEREIAGRLTVSAAAAHGEFLRPWLAGIAPAWPALPKVSEVKAGGEIAFTGRAWRADSARVAGRVYGVEVAAEGRIADLRRWRGVDMAVTARADSLRHLPLPSAAALAALGAAQAQARLADDAAGAFHLADLRALTGADESPLKAWARGEIRDLGPGMRATVALDAQLDSLAPFAARLPAAPAGEFAPLLARALPLRASATLHSTSPADWALRDITVAPAAVADSKPRLNAELTGAVARFTPLDARLHFAVDGVALADLPDGWNIPRPRGGELEARLELVAGRGGWRVENLRAEVDHAAVEMTARGGVERLNPLAIAALDVEFSAPDWLAMNWLGGRRVARGVPVAGRITASVDAAGEHAAVDITVGGSDIRGNVDWQAAGGGDGGGDQNARPKITAKLDSSRLDLREIFGTPPKPPKPTPPRARLFSPARIDAGWMRAVDADLQLTAAALATRRLDLRDVALQFDLQNGVLRQSVAAGMGAGELTAALAIDAGAAPLRAEISAHGKQLDTANVVAIHKDDFIVGGAFDLDVELKSSGDSAAELAAAAAGEASLALTGARMKNQSLDIFGGDIFSNLVTAVNPFRSIGEYVDIECAIAHLDVEDGVATIRDRLAVKTDRVTLSGGGDINLGSEELKIVILPRARKGFGINTASLAKIVRLGGTLAQPKIEADASRLLQTGAEWLAAVYSAGWSLIAQGLFDRIQANTDVCGQNGVGDGDATVDAGESASVETAGGE